MSGEEDARAALLRHRASIDNIDAAVVHLMAERFKHTRAVGALKAAHDLPPEDPGREAAQTARLRALAESAGLAPEFAERLLRLTIDEAITQHKAQRAAAGRD